jgi:hypothetical protein
MPKTNLSDILVHGENFKIRSLKDMKPSDMRIFDRIAELQKESQARKSPNWSLLRNFRIFPRRN